MKKQQQPRGGGGGGGGGRGKGDRARRTGGASKSTSSRTSREERDPQDRARRSARPVNARLRARAHVTPWKSYDEFDDVGQSLMLLLQQIPTVEAATQPPLGPTHPSTPQPTPELVNGQPQESTDVFQQSSPSLLQHQVEEALERVEVWRLRCGGPGFLPHSVESTHALASCLYEDRYSSTTQSHATLALMYASAITRTVNGLTDVLQQNRAMAASVAHLGRLLGLPAWIIDIRHQATHNAMPSLPILRTAAQTLLVYLDQVYWTPMRKRRLEAVALAQRLVQSHRPGDALDGRKSAAQQSPKVADSRIFGSEDDRGMSDYYVDDDYAMGPSDVDDVDVRSEGENEASDEPASSVALPHKVLGTTFNRFAALLDDTKSKKKKKNTATEPQGEEIAAEALDSAPKQPAPPEPGWNCVPVDVAYRAVADHVIQYCRQATSPPSPHVSVPPPELSIFVEMSRRYPGLVKFVARELELMDGASSSDEVDADHAGVPILSGRDWAEYVRRLASAHGITSPSNKRPRHDASTAASVDVAGRASSILRRHGAGASLSSSVSLATHLLSPKDAAASMNQVSLDAMEAFLNQAETASIEVAPQCTPMPFDEMLGKDNDTATAAPGVETPPTGEGGGGWSICETWEPCAIGTSFIRRT